MPLSAGKRRWPIFVHLVRLVETFFDIMPHGAPHEIVDREELRVDLKVSELQRDVADVNEREARSAEVLAKGPEVYQLVGGVDQAGRHRDRSVDLTSGRERGVPE